MNYWLLSGLIVCLAGAARAEDTVTVTLDPLGIAEQDLSVGGLNGKTAIVPLNLPLLRHVVLQAEDIQEATLKLSCRRQGPRIDLLAHGMAQDGQSVRLADQPTLKAVPLKAGQQLALTVWKADWHFNGGATLAGLKIVGVGADGQRQETTLPATFDKGTAQTELGTLTLAGLFNRDKFPVFEKQVTAKAGDKPGAYTVAEGHGVSLTLVGGGLSFHTNGRSNFGPEFGWAPALVFTAAHDGTYTIEGDLKFRCARPEMKVAWTVGCLQPAGGPLGGTVVSLHRLLREPAAAPVAGADYDQEPIARFRLIQPTGGTVVITNGVAASLRNWLSGTWPDHGLLLRADKTNGVPADVLLAKSITGTATIRSYPKHVLFDQAIKPQPGVYATTKDGKLDYGGKRLRLWSTVKDVSGERLRELGFNCERVWNQGDLYDDESAKKGVPMTYTMGDDSKLDKYDKWMADLRTNGIFVMLATTIGQGMPMKPLLADDSWIAGGADWPQWKAAAAEAKGETYRLAYVDDRLWKARLRHAENFFNHKNPYTGQRYAEAENIVLVEVNNEAGLIQAWLERGFEKWPAYFRNALQVRWNTWLSGRYANDAALQQAWGKLDDGESLGQKSVKPAPILGERAKYATARQSDFIRFLYELIDTHNQEYRTFCRTLASKGVGVNVVPFSFDTQYRPSIPWLYTNWKGDTSTLSMYFWSNGSMLLAPPALYVLDSHRLQDKLAVIYETTRGRPSPYRAEYPYMLAVMTCWQDFDIVSWHGSWIRGNSNEQLLAGTVPPPVPTHYWTGVEMQTDPAETAAMALAGRLYLSGAIETAPKPVVYTVGKQGLFSFNRFNGIGGRDMSLRTFQRGTRIALEPERDCDLLLDGQEPPPVESPTGPVLTGENVVWDWQNGRLIIDSPLAKVYAGRTVPAYRFKDGITLSGFNTPFLSFALVSADGQPLATCRKAYVSAVFDAKNTGFDYDYTVPGGPSEQAKAVRNRGHAPILVDKVSYTVSFPTALDGKFTGYDFALRQVDEVTLTGQNTLRRPEQTLWMGLLEITSRGKPMEPVTDASPGAPAVSAVSAVVDTEPTDPRLAGLYNPVPGLSWGDGYHRSHRLLRDASFLKTAVTPEDMSNLPDKAITVSEAEFLLKTPANVDVVFAGDRMTQIVVTFTQAPAFAELLANFKKQFGDPVREKLVNSAAEQSEVQWSLRKPEGTVTILATEFQGVVRVTYALPR